MPYYRKLTLVVVETTGTNLFNTLLTSEKFEMQTLPMAPVSQENMRIQDPLLTWLQRIGMVH